MVKVLDADDTLTPGALPRDIDVFEREPEVAWTTSRVLDAMPVRSTVGFDGDPEEGAIERGSVHEHWKANDYRARVHPATLCVRRDPSARPRRLDGPAALRGHRGCYSP